MSDQRRAASDREPGSSPRLWDGYLAFWLVAAVVLVGIGLGTVATASHELRLGIALIVLGGGCALFAHFVRAGRRGIR
jgi:hypothetical protein